MALADAPGAMARLDRALEADPSFAPALLDRLLLGLYAPATLAVLGEVRESGAHPLRRCADAALSYGVDVATRYSLSELDRTVCDRIHHLAAANATLKQDAQHRLALEAFNAFPESVYLFRLALTYATSAGAWETVLGIAEANRTRSVLHAALAEPLIAAALHRLERHDEALALERELGMRRLAPIPAQLATDVASLHLGFPAEAVPGLRAHFATVGQTYLDALSAWRSVPVPALRFDVGLSRLRSLVNSGRLREALEDAPDVEALADSLGNPFARSQAALFHGRAAVKAGHPALAEERLLAARAAAEEGEVVGVTWEVDHNLLHLYESTGRDSMALQAGLDFASITSSVPLRAERMMAYHDLGVHLRQRGQWEEAQRWFEQMLVAIDSLGQGAADFFAGEYLESVGQLERALAYYRGRALRDDPGRALPALVRISQLLGDTAQALRYAIEHDGLIYNENPEGRPLLPGVLARMGHLDEASVRLQSARGDAMRRSQRAAWGRLTMELAGVELARGDESRAQVLVDSALPALDDPVEREFRMRALGVGALAAARMSGPDATRRMEQLARARAGAFTSGNAALAAELAVLEGDAWRLLGDTARALRLYERAQEGVDSLVRTASGDATRASLLAAQRSASGHALEIALARAGRREAGALWRIWSDRRKGRTVDNARSIPANQVAGAVTDRVILDYVLLDSTVAVLVLADGRTTIRDLGVRPADVAMRIERLHAVAAPRIGSVIDASRARLDQVSLTWLSSALLGPVLPDLGHGNRIEIVPDGFLHLVPFDVLPVGDGDELVLERFTTSLAPSLRMAGGVRAVRDDRPATVVAGAGQGEGAAPGADAEVREVRQAIRTRPVRVLTGSAATETAVRDAMREAGVIHLAAHAVPNAAQPDFAEVWLAPDASSDGRLQAFEIRPLDLGGATVVLSACETGAGAVAGGEGPISLARAFLQAGAGDVVATLWPVRENAARVMARFHALLDGGADPAVALREARLALLRDGADPLTVAPWVILAGRR